MSQSTIEKNEVQAYEADGEGYPDLTDYRTPTPAELNAKKIGYLERRLTALPKEFRPAFIRQAKASGLFEGYEEHMERLSK